MVNDFYIKLIFKDKIREEIQKFLPKWDYNGLSHFNREIQTLAVNEQEDFQTKIICIVL